MDFTVGTRAFPADSRSSSPVGQGGVRIGAKDYMT